jgi:histone H3/H4
MAPVKRIIQQAGGKRVSDEAVVELIKVLEEYGVEIGAIATKLGNHA